MNTGRRDRVERRLAGILAADVAGYSRLMGADEEGTLRQLNARRDQLIDPKIGEHRGGIVKTGIARVLGGKSREQDIARSERLLGGSPQTRSERTQGTL
jgi:hypothetical protein